MKDRMNTTCRVLFTELKNHFKHCCNEMLWQIQAAEHLRNFNSEMTESVRYLKEELEVSEKRLFNCKLEQAAATVEISSWKASLEDAHIEMKCLQKSNCELLTDKKLLQEQLLCRTTAHEIDKEKLALLEKKTEELRLKICRSVNPLTDSSEVPSCSENTAILAVDPNCKQISPVYQKYKDYQTETSDLITKIREQHTEIYRLKEEIIKLNTILDELRTADKSTDEYPTSACDSVVNLKQDDEKLTISKLQQLLKSQNFQNFSLKNKIVENNAVIAELQSAMMGKDFNRNTTECQQSTSQNLCCGKSKELEEKLRICACQLFQAEEKCKTLVVDLDIAWNEVDREKKLGQVYCQRIDELRSDISEKTLEANHWENQYHDLRKKLLDSQTIRSDQINEIDKLKSKISHLNSQLSETGKNQNKHYERMLKCANERISSLLTVISTVKGELSELKQGRKGKQQDVASMQIKYEENIKSCHCVIQNSQDTIKKLEEKCYHLDIELETMTNELVKKQNETLEFAQREAQLQQIITDKELEWTQRIRESQAEIYKLTDIVNSLNNDLSIGKAEIEMRRSQQCVAERRLRDAIDCIEKLKNEMEKKDYFAHKLQDALCSTGFKVVQHSKRIDQLENYTACSHQENAVLKASLTKALKGRSDCEEELCKKTEEIKNLNLELYKMKMEKDNITKEANNCHQRLQEKLNGEAYERHCLKEEVDRLKRVLNSVYSQCLKERDTFEEELSKGKDGIFKLKEELEYLRKCHEDSLKLINQKEEYIQNMKCSFLEKGVHNKTENKKIKDRTMCCQERSYLETEVKKLGQVITELESQIKEKDQCINRMKNMTAKDTETINEIEKLKEKLTMNCQAKSLLETEVQKLCQTISRLQSEILEKNKMIKILEGKLKKYENSLKSQCQENLELHERIKQITSASCIVHIKPSTTCTHKFHRKTTT